MVRSLTRRVHLPSEAVAGRMHGSEGFKGTIAARVTSFFSFRTAAG